MRSQYSIDGIFRAIKRDIAALPIRPRSALESYDAQVTAAVSLVSRGLTHFTKTTAGEQAKATLFGGFAAFGTSVAATADLVSEGRIASSLGYVGISLLTGYAATYSLKKTSSKFDYGFFDFQPNFGFHDWRFALSGGTLASGVLSTALYWQSGFALPLGIAAALSSVALATYFYDASRMQFLILNNHQRQAKQAPKPAPKRPINPKLRREIELCYFLGVKADDDSKTVKKAYKKLARTFHPDMKHAFGSETQFKKIDDAYKELRELKESRGAPGWNKSRPTPDTA